MARHLLIVFGMLALFYPMLIHPARGATSTIYAAAPTTAIVPTSTRTFKPLGEVSIPSGAASITISRYGDNAFFATSCCSGPIIETSLTTGKTVHSYQTQFAPSGGLIVLPNESQLYVGTCSLSPYYIFVCASGYVEIFDVASEQELAVISLDGDVVYSFAVSSNGSNVYVLHGNPSTPYGCCDGIRGLVAGVSPQTAYIPPDALTAISTGTLQVGASYADGVGCFFLGPCGGSVVIAGDTGYVMGSLTGSLVAINLQQMTLERSVVLPSGFYLQSIAISASGTTLAVAGNSSSAGNQLLLVDTATGAISRTVSASASNSLWISSNASTVYFLDSGGVESLNAGTGAIMTEIPAASEPIPMSSFILLPGGNVLYLILSGSPILRLQETLKPTATLNVTQEYTWLAVSPNNETLYLANLLSGITAISSTTGAVISTLIPNTQVFALAVSADGSTLYALSPSSFLIINISTGAVENTLALQGCPFFYLRTMAAQIALSPSGNYAYASFTNNCDNPVLNAITTPINLTTQTTEAPINGQGGPVAVSPSGQYLYTSSLGPMEVIDLTTGNQVGTIPITAGAIVFSPDGTKAYITSSDCNFSYYCSNGVSVVDTSTLQVLSFIPDGATGSEQGLAISNDGLFLYVAGGPIIYTPTMAILGQMPFGPPIVVH